MNELRHTSDLVRNSLLYRESREEHEEILRHKWLESEKQGHDIGLDRARADWRMRHRTQWLRARRAKRNPPPFEI